MKKELSASLYNALQLSESTENVWLLELQELVLANLTTEEFSVSQLATLLQVSPRTLYYKVKTLTGFSPSKYINEMRLQKAVQLIQNQVYPTVSEVSYAVGFQRPAYFSILFKKRFNVLPSDFLRRGGPELQIP